MEYFKSNLTSYHTNYHSYVFAELNLNVFETNNTNDSRFTQPLTFVCIRNQIQTDKYGTNNML